MLTLIISSYKYGHLAAHCIESILSQSKRPEKIYFVDDGVGDCNHLVKLYPDINFILREKNLGTVDNFQDMLMRVDTEYTMFLGADNWLRSDAIELLSKMNTDIITYDIMVTGELKDEIIKRHGSYTYKFNGDIYWSRKKSHHGSMMYRTKIGQKVGYRKYGDNKQTQEDWSLWLGMVSNGASISHIEEGLLYYRRHKENFFKY